MLFGYEITAVVVVSLISLISLLIMDRRELSLLLSRITDKYSISFLLAVLLFFIIFSLLFVSPTEQLYFDENIYQGVALNILQHGNALWCQAGTGYISQCFSNSIYHDPVGWSFFIAIAFAIFGASASTAYALQLLVGALSIIAFFLLASSLFDKAEMVIPSTMAFALMPLLFIWSRTEAVMDLPFMMLSTFSFSFFAIFSKKPSIKALGIFLSSLVLTIYTRTEAILLIGVFAILYLASGGMTMAAIKQKARIAISTINTNREVLATFTVFVLLLLPQVYYIGLELNNGDYGQSFTSQELFSVSNLVSNSRSNIEFLFGGFDSRNYYPAIFPGVVTMLAVYGAFLFVFDRRSKNRLVTILSPLIWFITYFLFYGAFYAGSATFGVDSRFMLQLLPSLSLLAGLGVYEIADIAYLYTRRLRARRVASGILAIVLILLPFITLAPLITLKISQMPQQANINPGVDFIYANYNKVPSNCLVFSFTPDLWYILNRSSAQISYLGTGQLNISNYSCLILDYGYWCIIPPYHSTTCQNALNKYSLRALATNTTNAGYNTTLYQILNYTK